MGRNDMSGQEKQLNPSSLSDEQVKILAFTVAGILSSHFESDKPMRAEEAMKFLSLTRKPFYRLVNLGVIKAHRFEENSYPYFLRSELLAQLKSK
jgi:hypothetical protein